MPTAIALQGTRLSFDKNFFEQKTTEALISQMRATRKTQEAQLLLNLNQRSAKDYTLEQTWTDLIRYYHAGTISSALVDIASKAGADDVKAGQTLATVQSDLIKNVINIRQTRDGLAKDIGSSDPAVAAAATAKLTQIVTALNLTATPADANSMLQALTTYMKQAVDDDVKLAALTAALKAATQPVTPH